MMKHSCIAALGLLFASCTQPTTTGTNPPTPRGAFAVYAAGNGIDVEITADVTPLSLAATVVVEGAGYAAAAERGAAIVGRDLFTQRTSGNELRFAVSDSRALRIARTGVVVHIPTSGAPTRVIVRDISAADGDGNPLVLTGFEAAPRTR